MFRVFEKPARFARKAMRIAAGRVRGLSRGQRSRICYYAALAALLARLGSASYSYRLRDNKSDLNTSEAYRSAVAMNSPEPSPAPTPVPVEWVWPLEGEIIGEYAPDTTVWSSTLGQWQTHPAVDIAGSPGEAVCACAAGTVTDAWQDALWGNVIRICHPGGVTSTYANLNTLNMVEIGRDVSAGEVISAVGQSAGCEAEMPWHLHFSVERDGEPVDFFTLAGQMGG